jgi:hypothetical protein
MQLQVRDLKGRVARLERPAKGLAREVGLHRDANDLLLYRERKAYIGAIQDTLAGVEAACVTLAGAVRRLEGG